MLQIFYLFNVRYLGMPSLTLRGVIGTRAVLIAVGLVTALQLLFTYAPFMQTLFQTRPVSIAQGLLVIGIGAAAFALIEIEKALHDRLGRARR